MLVPAPAPTPGSAGGVEGTAKRPDPLAELSQGNPKHLDAGKEDGAWLTTNSGPRGSGGALTTPAGPTPLPPPQQQGHSEDWLGAWPGDEERLLRTIAALLDCPIYGSNDMAQADATDDRLRRALKLTATVRRLATARVGENANEAAYLLPLFQWMVPVVAFYGTDIARMRISAVASGLVMERVLSALGITAE